MTQPYTHIALNQEIESIGGRYVLDNEECVTFQGRSLLVVYGYSSIDCSCCGTGGCRFANVPGFIVSLRNRKDNNGLPVSEVEPIDEENTRSEIAAMITDKESYCQVNF